jgi:hypothetical protein
MKDNPEFPYQVYRRYNDFHWLIQALQIDFPACIIWPLPQKTIMQQIYSDDSEFIKERVKGFQVFIDYLITHPILCDSPDFKVFLIGQTDEFEFKKQERSQIMSAYQVNQDLARVLLDGSDEMLAIGTNGNYYGQTIVNTSLKAVKGISKYTSILAGALYNGASYVIGSGGESEVGGGSLVVQGGELRVPAVNPLYQDGDQISVVNKQLTFEET